MFSADPHPLLVPRGKAFRVAAASTASPPGAERSKQALAVERRALGDWQRKLYADRRYALLLIFQALDSGGKDSTIRHVFTGVNPTGLHVVSFKQPSAEELAHDFLWRTSKVLPQRGHIAVFNRSYYEEVLVVRVHPELLDAQRLPERPRSLWADRYRSIVEHELHLARQGTVILKFWLNVSPDEQRRRFLSRLAEPEKHWKFSSADLEERRHWAAYRHAYEQCLRATSRPWAPWYAVPADDKPYCRLQVAKLVNAALAKLDVDFPRPHDRDLAAFAAAKAKLQIE